MFVTKLTLPYDPRFAPIREPAHFRRLHRTVAP
jgi:hypothetical protein